jgi:hypothetical protein
MLIRLEVNKWSLKGVRVKYGWSPEIYRKGPGSSGQKGLESRLKK